MSAAQPANRSDSHYPLKADEGQKSWRTLMMMVQDESGAILRVANLFSSRGYNMQSIAASIVDPEKGISCISVVLYGSDKIIDQITKELERLVYTYKVVDITHDSHGIERELVLVKIKPNEDSQSEILSLISAFKANIVESNDHTYIVELAASPGKINALIDLARPLGVIEIARSGAIGLINDEKALTDIDEH